MKKLCFTAGIIGLIVFAYFSFNPIIIDLKKEEENLHDNSHLSNDTIKIFEQINFDEGEYEALLIIDDDYEISSKIQKGKVLKTSNKELLKKMQENWMFKQTKSDIATVENELLLYKNDALIFRSGIVVDEKVEGLQSREFGWVVPIKHNLSKDCGLFSRVYFPIVIL